MAIKLKKCPHCKQDDYFEIIHHKNSDWYCVRCLGHNCLAQGPVGDDEKEAIEKWNGDREK